MELTQLILKPRQCRFVITYGEAFACGHGVAQHCITGCALDQGADECSLFRLRLTQKPKKKTKKKKQ